jgi:hypothetical protein
LIYFLFRDDTYVVSSVFACLMIIGELAAGVRILLEKGPSRHHISEDQQFQENTQKFIFHQKTKVAEGESEGSSQGPTPPGGVGQPLAAPPSGVASLAHFCQRPLAYNIAPEILRPKGGSKIESAASAGQKTPREKKLSSRQQSTREIPSRRGEIVAIVIAIELGFIGIIIFITIITITFIFTITTPSRCNILG